MNYSDFMIDSWFYIFDLSTNGKSGEDYVVPAVRLGTTALHINFSEPTPEELSIVVYTEMPSMIQISDNGTVKMTYLKATGIAGS